MTWTGLDTVGAAEAVLASDGTFTLQVPIRLRRRSSRKLVQLPPQATEPGRPWDRHPTPLQVALARAFRWLQALESGQVASISEMARREGTDFGYVSRVLNLSTLAPEIIDGILDDTLPEGTTLNTLAINPPLRWDEQLQRLKST